MARDIASLIRPGLGMSIYRPTEYDYDAWNGRLLMWEERIVGEEYAIGVDPAEGVTSDRSVCQVIKKGNLLHPDVQVAEFSCDYLDPIDFASVVRVIGDFYRDQDGTEAFCTVECNAPCGDTMIHDLQRRLDYTNLFIWKTYDRVSNVYTNKLGWWTNKSTRPKLIARGLHAMANGDLLLNSEFCIDEMADFERDHYIAKAKARYGRHDDRIMALLIAYWGAHDDEWMAGEDVAEERRMRSLAQAVIDDRIEVQDSKKKRADFQNTAITAREMETRVDDWLFED